MQYLARLLREPGEGRRIIYAESMFDEQKALNLLGTHWLDASATIFFGDSLRLHRDLQGRRDPRCAQPGFSAEYPAGIDVR